MLYYRLTVKLKQIISNNKNHLYFLLSKEVFYYHLVSKRHYK